MSFPRYPKYKDSGVEWLGQVPEHWEVQRVRWLCEIKKRIAGELGYEVLSITQQGVKVKDLESNEGQLSMDYSKYQLVEVGDFAMNHMDLLTGYVDISNVRGVTSPDYRVFSIRDPVILLNDIDLVAMVGGREVTNPFMVTEVYIKEGGKWKMGSLTFSHLMRPLKLNNTTNQLPQQH
jgi:hypothetical protein